MNTFEAGNMIFTLTTEGKIKVAHINEWWDERNTLTLDELELVCKCIREEMNVSNNS